MFSCGDREDRTRNRSDAREHVPKSFFNLYLHGDSQIYDPTKLLVAVKDSDIVGIKQILKAHKSLVHTPDENGRTALHWTVVLGDLRCTKLILKNTSWWYLDRCDYNGCTALHYAAQASKSDEVRLLLNRGAYTNPRDYLGRTPLHYAALTSNPFVIQKLVKHGGSLWMKDKEDHLPLDLAETHDVIVLIDKLMEPRYSCFRLCYAKPPRVTLHDSDKWPHLEPGPVRRQLAKNMLKTKLIADSVRKNHHLAHAELDSRAPKPDSWWEARKKEKALDHLLVRMDRMEKEDKELQQERKRSEHNKRQGLPADYYDSK